MSLASSTERNAFDISPGCCVYQGFVSLCGAVVRSVDRAQVNIHLLKGIWIVASLNTSNCTTVKQCRSAQRAVGSSLPFLLVLGFPQLPGSVAVFPGLFLHTRACILRENDISREGPELALGRRVKYQTRRWFVASRRVIGHHG